MVSELTRTITLNAGCVRARMPSAAGRHGTATEAGARRLKGYGGPVIRHGVDPFATPPERRSDVRRLRGRLAASVTVWTSGGADDRAGLTVSSLMVAEGEPSLVIGLMNDTTDLFDAIGSSGRFVVHLLGPKDRIVADRFAGLRPSPGGLFEDIETALSDWGPVMEPFPNRVYCRYTGSTAAGYHQLVFGDIDRIELDELSEPLLYFRGRYRLLK